MHDKIQLGQNPVASLTKFDWNGRPKENYSVDCAMVHGLSVFKGDDEQKKMQGVTVVVF